MKIKDLQNMLVEAQDKPGPKFYALPPGGGGGGGSPGGGNPADIRPMQPPPTGMGNWWELTGAYGDQLYDIFNDATITLINNSILGINYPNSIGSGSDLMWQTLPVGVNPKTGDTISGWGFVAGDGTRYIPVDISPHGFGWWPAGSNPNADGFYEPDPLHPNYPDNWDPISWNGADLPDGAMDIDPASGLPYWITDPGSIETPTSQNHFMDLVDQGLLPNWAADIIDPNYWGDDFNPVISWQWVSSPSGGVPNLVFTSPNNPLGFGTLVWSTAAGRWVLQNDPNTQSYWDTSNIGPSVTLNDPVTGESVTINLEKYDYGDGDGSGGGPPGGGGGDGPDTDPDGDGPDTDPDGDGNTPSKWSTSPGQSNVNGPRMKRRGNIDWNNILKALIKGAVD